MLAIAFLIFDFLKKEINRAYSFLLALPVLVCLIFDNLDYLF